MADRMDLHWVVQMALPTELGWVVLLALHWVDRMALLMAYWMVVP